jgi:hypothetical protein
MLFLTLQEAHELTSTIQSAIAGARNLAVEKHVADMNAAGFQSASARQADKSGYSEDPFVTVSVSSR